MGVIFNEFSKGVHEVQTNPPSLEGGGEGVGEAYDVINDPAPRQTLHRIHPDMRRRAATNRREPTQPERILWALLRKSQLGGLKFRRQTVIGSHIVDFCCPASKLIVEVDGESHVGRAAEDQARTRCLESLGYRVLRVTNDDVLCDLEAVGLAVLGAAGVDAGAPVSNAALHPPPRPLPCREGGSSSSVPRSLHAPA